MSTLQTKLLLLLKDWRLYVFGGLFLFNLFVVLAFSAPMRFPTGTIVHLQNGAGLGEISNGLRREGVIRSAVWFRAAVIALGGERGIQAGDYFLSGPETSIKLAWRMIQGERDIELVKITIPEGFTSKQIAELFDNRFMNLDKKVFLTLAPDGRMFPDTYFVQINIIAEGLEELLQTNFDKKVGTIKSDDLIMASILEAEVQTKEDRELVSGILWKRLKLGMALQVDSATSTYKTAGLPPKPINNPGLVAIDAALHPTASPYLYFMSDKEGKTHYAKTLDEQIANIKKYL